MYSYWDTDEMIKQFSGFKRFKSEIYFLDKILKPGMSILDIGCAQGNSYKDLKDKFLNIRYTGIDISEKMISRAKKSYPNVTFFTKNALDLHKEDEFDLVTATGVFQHESRYKRLFKKMVDSSSKYILFDVKLFHTHPGICDLKKAFAEIGNEKVPYNIFNLKEMIEMCLSNPKLNGNVQIYGYNTSVNKAVVLPKVNEDVCSAHFLLQKGKRESVKLELDLPEKFLENCFK